MDYQRAMQQIKTGVPPYIVFFGEEEYLKTQGGEQVINRLGITVPELNISIFEERPDSADVARAMETLPFMDNSRAVVVKNTDMLSAACPAEYTEKITDALMPAGNHLIIGAKGKLDKRKKLVKIIEKEGILVDCAPFSESQMASFVEIELKRRNLMVSPANARYLCELCDGGMQGVVNEIEKLAGVSRGSVTKEDIEKYVTKSLQYNVFRIHDLFCSRNIKAAKELLEKQLEDDPNPIGLLSLIAGNFKQMLVARACRDAGYDAHKTVALVMEETGAKEWGAKRALQNCKQFPANRLREGIKKLGAMDFDAKQGGIVLHTDLYPLLVDIYTTG